MDLELLILLALCVLIGLILGLWLARRNANQALGGQRAPGRAPASGARSRPGRARPPARRTTRPSQRPNSKRRRPAARSPKPRGRGARRS